VATLSLSWVTASKAGGQADRRTIPSLQLPCTSPFRTGVSACMVR
jgi:hypothetical protein